MECSRGRPRGRRGRCCSYNALPHFWHSSRSISRNEKRSGSLLDTVYSFLVLSSLIAVVYLILEYHCNTCSSATGSINAITKNLEDIATNLAVMKTNYVELETKISEFSKEFPRLEGQIEVLEALASTMEQQGRQWNPRTSMCLPNVDISLANKAGDLYKRNCTLAETRFLKPVRE